MKKVNNKFNLPLLGRGLGGGLLLLTLLAVSASCNKTKQEAARTIVLSAPEENAAYNLDAVSDITFSWSLLDDIDRYRIALSRSESMAPAVTVDAAVSPHTVPAAELDEALQHLGMTDSETDTVYWSVRSTPILMNIETQQRTLMLTRKPRVPVLVAGVTVDPPTMKLGVGASASATATITPTYADNKEVHWESSHPDIASVTSDGLTCMVTANSLGNATITVTSVADNSKTATIAVEVAILKLTSFTVTPDRLDLPENGASATLTINKTPTYASGTFTFTSNNTGVVTVSDAGVVTVAGQGSATITVRGTGSGGAVTPVEVPVTVLAPLNRRSWTATATSVYGDSEADRALDDDIDTEWHSGGSRLPTNPEIITVDMKGEKTITGFYFVHRQVPWLVGYPKEIIIETNNNSAWTQAWSNVGRTGLPGVDADLEYIYRLPLASAITAQYFRITVVSTHRPDGDDHTYTYFAEVGVYNAAEDPSEALVGITPEHYQLTDDFTVKYVNEDGSIR